MTKHSNHANIITQTHSEVNMSKEKQELIQNFINRAYEKTNHCTDSPYRDLEILSENYAQAQEDFLTFFLDSAPNDIPSDLIAQMLMAMAQIHDKINGTNDDRYLEKKEYIPEE